MAKIIGNTTATPNPRPDWNQTDETKADFIKNKPTIVDNLTSTSATDVLSAAQGKVLDEKIAAINTNLEDKGVGDMLKSVYDTDNDGIVDNAEKLGGYTPDEFVKLNEENSGDLNVNAGSISLQGENNSFLYVGLDEARMGVPSDHENNYADPYSGGYVDMTLGSATIGCGTANKIHVNNGTITLCYEEGGNCVQVKDSEGNQGVILADLSGIADDAYKLGGVNASEYAKKTDIPATNNATLTIQKNGADIATFTANSDSDVTANITTPINEGISENSLIMLGNSAGALGYYFATLSIAEDGLSADVTLSQDGAFESSTGTIDPTTIGWEVGDRVSIVNGNMFDDIGTVSAISNTAISFTFTRSIKTDYDDIVYNDQDKSIVNIDKPDKGIIDFGINTVALGKDNKALLSYSFVHGWNNEAIGKYSTIFGRENRAHFCSIALGRNNNVQGMYAHAFGMDNTITENGGHGGAFGTGNTIAGSVGHAFGINNNVSGRAASALGIGLIASTSPQTVVGKYNAESADAYFVVGAGTGSSGRKNILEVTPTTLTVDGKTKLKGAVSGGTANSSGTYSASFGKSSDSTYYTTGECAFSAGINNINGYRAAATFGIRSQAGKDCQFVCGKDNAFDTNALFIVGNGSGSTKKENAFVIAPEYITAKISAEVDLGDVGTDTVSYGLTLDKTGLTTNASITTTSPLYASSLNSTRGWLYLGDTLLTETKLKKMLSFLDTIAD